MAREALQVPPPVQPGRPLRVLHLITRMIDGGAQRNTMMCAAEQARRGHQVTLATGVEAGSEGSILEEARREPFRLVEIPDLIRDLSPIRDLKAFYALWRLIGEGYDVVHTHTSKAGLLGRWAAWLRRAPVVVHTPHGHVFHGYFSPGKTALFKWLERISARITHKIITLTEGDRLDHIQERIAEPELFLTIPSGVVLGSYAPGDRRPDAHELGLPDKRPLIGSVARLVEIKGVLDTIEAMPEILRRHPSAHLVWVGDGPLRSEVQRRIQSLGVENHVTLTGHRSDVARFLHVFDLFVLPSHNEGMGRAAVEAMAAGLPVVATDVGGLPYVVDHGRTGWLVPPRNPKALADAVSGLLDQPDTGRAMGREGQERAQQFADRVMYDRLEELYQQLASRKVAAYA